VEKCDCYKGPLDTCPGRNLVFLLFGLMDRRLLPGGWPRQSVGPFFAVALSFDSHSLPTSNLKCMKKLAR
jgi:hypothetical protein